MKSLMRKIIPQILINYFWHLPKAILANIYYGFPSRDLTVIGITGTDGKTTITNMIYQILKDAGKKVSMVSTINAFVAGKSYDTGFHVTSPDPFAVQKFAQKARANGDEYLVLEVTSHSLDQFRFWGTKFDVGVIINITHEHLDYHKTFENYFRTKVGLLKNVKFAIVNESVRPKLDENLKKKVLTFSLKVGDFKRKDVNFKLKIPGNYNIENALAAYAVASVLGINQGLAKKTLNGFSGLAGRMERVPNQKGIKIFIDFAHTPNALEQALKSLRSHPRGGKLISLIGCEGFRDPGKREPIGEISGKLADYTIVTAVDPRGQLDEINKQIITGLEKAGLKKDQGYFVVDNRQEAINFAVQKLAKKNDVVGIFGKGHENSMNLDGKKELPWSDKLAVKKALNG